MTTLNIDSLESPATNEDVDDDDDNNSNDDDKDDDDDEYDAAAVKKGRINERT